MLDSSICCLSYLTIELKGLDSRRTREARLASTLYGCDICQDVCPWNFASTARSASSAWLPRAGLDRPRLLDLWLRSDDELRALLKGSAMKRAGVRRFRRNLAVSIGNSGDPAAVDALATSAGETCADPIGPGARHLGAGEKLVPEKKNRKSGTMETRLALSLTGGDN